MIMCGGIEEEFEKAKRVIASGSAVRNKRRR